VTLPPGTQTPPKGQRLALFGARPVQRGATTAGRGRVGLPRRTLRADPRPYHPVMTSGYFVPPIRPQRTVVGQREGRPLAPPMIEVFLSHATKDVEYVAVVRRQLEALGILVYLAEHDPQPGAVLAEKVRAAIHRCQAVVVLFTTTSINSAYVQQEVGIAHECGKPLVPIVEKGVDTSQLGILQGVEYLELDLDRPAETLAKMTASLQPLVLEQVSVNVSVVSVTRTGGRDVSTDLVLVGLGLVLGVLIMAALSSGGSGSA